jgi:hypothetical protein
VLVVAEGRAVLIAGGAIKPDCLWLLDACFQTNSCDAPMAGDFFQRVQQTSTEANSPGVVCKVNIVGSLCIARTLTFGPRILGSRMCKLC